MKGIVAQEGQLVMAHDVELPDVSEDEVLVQVISTTMNPGDPSFALGAYDEFFPDSHKKQRVKSGFELAGLVVQDSNDFKAGDKVYSYVDIVAGEKAHQEYAVLNHDVVARMPATLDFDQAATIPCGAMTVLGALRDVAAVKPAERVLINGAAGGLGVYAVQMAKLIYKAHVTAVAGSGQDEHLRGLGADEVIDYRLQPLNEWSEQYDVILDLACNMFYADIKHLLSINGRFVPADPMRNAADLEPGTEAAEHTESLLVAKGNRADLDSIARWVDTGLIKPVIDSRFQFEDFKQAIDRLSVRGKSGRIVLKVKEY